MRPDAAALLTRARPLLPGLLVAAVIALAAGTLSARYGAPVMLFALLIGMALNFLADDDRCKTGIDFAAKPLLRLGVMLLGMRITVGDLAALGLPAILTVAALIAVTIGTGFVGARFFGRGWRFALLTGGAVAICGASAALALAAIIPPNDKSERNTLFTVVSVTTLSTVAMVLYPPLFSALGLSDREMGFMLGATIHDVAQVVGAGYSVSEPAGDLATVVKLLRVALLPVVLMLALLVLPRPEGGASLMPPWFVLGFAGLALLNSTGLVPGVVVAAVAEASRWLLVLAIAALGVKTALKALAVVGGGHVAIVVLETVVLALAALLVVQSGLLGL